MKSGGFTEVLSQNNDELNGLGRIVVAARQKTYVGMKPYKFRTLPSFALVYLYDGSGFYNDEDGMRELKSGDCILLPPGRPHSYGPSDCEQWNELYFIFEGTMFMEWEVSGIINKMLPVLHLHPIALWLNSLERICSSGLSCLQQVCQLQLWLANAFCHNNRNEKMSEGVLWLERAEKLLLVESMGDYDIKKVCDQLAMSYESFRHRFKILAGISPGKFCAQKRIEESARMIAETNFSFKKIAYILGFCDEYHFSKVFKKIMGIPPGVWRKQFFK